MRYQVSLSIEARTGVDLIIEANSEDEAAVAANEAWDEYSQEIIDGEPTVPGTISVKYFDPMTSWVDEVTVNPVDAPTPVAAK
jgi:hypothetical protein